MLQDLRSAVRSLASTPAFTIVALVVLALGIGAGTAIFSVVDAVVLRGLPFDEYDRLAALFEKDTQHAVTFGEGSVTPQTYLDWRHLQQPFSAIAATSSMRYALETLPGSEPADADAQRVTWELFPVLRVAPMLGRALTADDEVEGHEQVVLLSYGFWRSRFGGAPDVVGKTLQLSRRTYEIVGVMPPSFSFPIGSNRPAALFVPLAFSAEARTKGPSHNYNYRVIGRLKPGVSFQQASDEMWRLSEQLDRADPKWAPGRRARVESLQAFTVGDARGWMLLLLGAVVLVLLIACANVANLMLARATVRAREMSIRAAMGATPWRLMRAQLVEGLVLALSATAVGMALAAAATGTIRAWLPANVPRVSTIQIDGRVLAAAVLAALVTGVAFAMAPAWFGARSDLVESLKDGGRSATAGRRGRRLRSLLVVGEIAIAVMLVAGAGLFTGSFIELMRVDPGFDYHNVLTLDVWLPREPGETFDRAAYAERSRRYYERIVEVVGRAPGVEGVATVQGGVPLTGSWSRGKVTLPGRGELTGEGDDIDIRRVTPNYLQLMRIPLVKGRYLTRDDRANAPLVLVINRAAAARYWPGQDALGRQVTIGGDTFTVVGVVGNVHHLGPEIAPRQECYMTAAQAESYGGSLVIRTAGEAMAVLPAVKAAIWSVNPEQRLTGETVTLEGYMDRLIAQRRFNMAVLALFGLLGLVIAAVGVYGVMAYLVAQRTNEIGVRLALGATRGNVLALVLRGAAVLSGTGLAIGGVAAWYLSAGLQTFLFQIRPADPRILGGAVATLALAALAATAIPARRAAGVDPLVALRRE